MTQDALDKELGNLNSYYNCAGHNTLVINDTCIVALCTFSKSYLILSLAILNHHYEVGVILILQMKKMKV